MIEVPAWGYYWGLNKAQVDLMLHDRPVVDYKSSKRDKDGNKKPSRRAIEEANERGKQIYEERKSGKKMNLNKFFRKDNNNTDNG